MRSNITTKIAKEIVDSYVIESWRSDDGSSWYRLYSDGWIEQGGRYSNSSTAGARTITFPIEFTTTNVYINRNASGCGSPSNELARYWTGYTSKTATSFTYWGERVNYSSTDDWYACGY